MAASFDLARRLSRFPPVIRSKWLFMRTFATRRQKVPKISAYEVALAASREQADRSLLATIGGPTAELYALCAQHGAVAALFPFSSNGKAFALVEMRTEAGLQAVLQQVRQFPNTDRIPARARFLYMERSNQRSRRQVPPSIFHETPVPPDPTALNLSLRTCASVSHQIERLYSKTQMSELASRLRFLLISVLQETLRGTLHTCRVTPFGSAVNGFGRYDCDLDLLLEMDAPHQDLQDASRGGLYYMSKIKQDNGRYQSQLALDTIGGIIAHFTPQFTRVHRILRARVPIIKFHHIATSVECDLSISDRSGLYMSELLYLFGECDERVRPLVYAVRHWAANADITRSTPGPWISNFMLTWFVVYFLQVTSKPILPSITTLRRMAGPNDKKEVDGEDMTFLTDWTKVPRSRNTQSLDELFRDFFDFYATLNFAQFGISVVDACTITKPDPDIPMHLENPLQRNLNASKNVSADQILKWQDACKKASIELRGATPLSVLSTPASTVPFVNANNKGDEPDAEPATSETPIKVSMTDLFSEEGTSSTSGTSTNKRVPEEEWNEGDRDDDADVSSPLTGVYKEYTGSESDSNGTNWVGGEHAGESESTLEESNQGVSGTRSSNR